jgi:hypothetical protein
MPINVNDGSWRTTKVPYVKDNNIWRPIKKVWVRSGGSWRLVYGTTEVSTTFNVGTVSWTVPEGVFAIDAIGGGGGGGGGGGDGGANNSGPGRGGGGANLISGGPYSVTPGQILTVTVGAGGEGSTGNGINGGTTSIVGNTTLFSALGAEGGGGYYNGLCCGFGVYGGTRGERPTAGVTTNGGANGGAGGPYSRRGPIAGGRGQDGKLTISWANYL